MAKRKIEVTEAAATEEPTKTVFVGSIVHFVMPMTHAHRPAIVTECHGEGVCNLVVFVDGQNDGHSAIGSSYWIEKVRKDFEGSSGTWHFMETEG